MIKSHWLYSWLVHMLALVSIAVFLIKDIRVDGVYLVRCNGKLNEAFPLIEVFLKRPHISGTNLPYTPNLTYNGTY